jgi:ADP-L-glycero-D-manno-heptose 6-epimerase
MVVVTGAAGFIGSCFIRKLNDDGIKDIIIVDDFSDPVKNKNLTGKEFALKIRRQEFLEWFAKNPGEISFVFHIGARTDTTEFNRELLNELNFNYSQSIWEICAENGIPLICASSAATYGLGEHGYKDDESTLSLLHPLNPYGESKNEFDKWAVKQKSRPPLWYGLKFFNVYGPNEYHKGRMASVIFHAYRQIREKGKMKLFRSHNPEYRDGEQLRDFIYVADILGIMLFLFRNKPASGIYNCGTGKARTFLDLAHSVFSAMRKVPEIDFIDTPEDIREKYQYFTQAEMQKLRNAGYNEPFLSLEEGVKEYVTAYLTSDSYY